MLKNTTAILLAAGLLALPMGAIAQQSDSGEAQVETETQEPVTQESGETEQPAAEVEGEGTMEEEDSSADDQMAEPAAEGEMAGMEEGEEMAEGEEAPEPVEGQIILQSDNSMLAGDMMGATVYSAEGESVGDISDLIVTFDGTVEGVVIGVGGFLGIGEKAVAIEMNQLQITQDEDGEPRLTTDATREDLEAAEEFVTAEEQRQQQDMQESADSMQTGGGNATGSDAGEMTTTAEEGASEVEQEAEEAGAEVEQEVEEAGAEAEQAVEDAGAEVEEAAEDAEAEIEQEAEEVEAETTAN